MQTESAPLPLSLTAPPVALREIDINVTNLCNLECIYCSYASTPSRDEPSLPADRIFRLLDEAAALGNRVVHFSGGEPVTRRDMPDLIRRAAELGFKMRTHSNGALLTEPKLTELWDAGLRQVLISLDGLEENHNYHRARAGLFPRTVRAIETAVRLGFNVRVNSVATTRNVDEIPQLMPMLADLGINTFSVFYCIPVGRGRHYPELMVPPIRWRGFIREMRETANRCKPASMEVTVEKVFQWADEWDDGVLDSGRGGSCLGFLEGCNYVNVLADGRVYPCVCFIDHAPALGNVLHQSLEEILHDPHAWSFYRELTRQHATCSACALSSRCRGGSRALGKILLDEWFAVDPRCSGDPVAQGFMPLCFMLRENVTTRSQSGFAEQAA